MDTNDNIILLKVIIKNIPIFLKIIVLTNSLNFLMKERV